MPQFRAAQRGGKRSRQGADAGGKRLCAVRSGNVGKSAEILHSLAVFSEKETARSRERSENGEFRAGDFEFRPAEFDFAGTTAGNQRTRGNQPLGAARRGIGGRTKQLRAVRVNEKRNPVPGNQRRRRKLHGKTADFQQRIAAAEHVDADVFRRNDGEVAQVKPADFSGKSFFLEAHKQLVDHAIGNPDLGNRDIEQARLRRQQQRKRNPKISQAERRRAQKKGKDFPDQLHAFPQQCTIRTKATKRKNGRVPAKKPTFLDRKSVRVQKKSTSFRKKFPYFMRVSRLF